ncbi:MAG: carboxypeptidase regulatory-like domain-containing protein, partial [Deltaproteobacteria bacterium]|nr:carboxypeptidase regulatory-like domain-containing protein [Deltaproteobacteria bacterium]
MATTPRASVLIGLLACVLATACSDDEKREPRPHACSLATIDPTIATDFYDAVRCLFEGEGAPQQGVAAGTITRERISVVRGRATDAAGEPIADARVIAIGHPEYGETSTGADGWFDMAVNGGGRLTFRFESTGNLPVQRHVLTQWREFQLLPPVALLG